VLVANVYSHLGHHANGELLDATRLGASAARGYAPAAQIAQPALSQQLAILENELEVKLLARSVSGVTPTPAGKILYARAQTILRQYDELRQAVHREVQPLSGTVTLGMSPTMIPRFALPLIEKVCTQHPELHLQIREEGSAALQELLASGRIELSISPTRPEGDIVGEEILTEPLLLLSSLSPPAQFVFDLLREVGEDLRMAAPQGAAHAAGSLDGSTTPQ